MASSNVVSKTVDKPFELGCETVQRIAKEQYQAGFQNLQQFMTRSELRAYLADPSNGQRFIGHAVHRATYKALERQYPDRFDYNSSRLFDFVDKTTGQAIELTTKKGVTTHQKSGADIVTYD